jgi:hypothetical protein
MWPIYSPVLLRNLVSVLLAEFPLENVVFLRLQPLHRCKFERNKLTMRRKLEFSMISTICQNYFKNSKLH